MHGDGTQSRDFTYVGTVSEVIVDAVTRASPTTTPVNLAFGSRDHAARGDRAVAGDGGAPDRRRHIEPRPGDVPHSQADNTLLRSLFPDVEPVALDDGLAATVDWMRSVVADAGGRHPSLGEQRRARRLGAGRTGTRDPLEAHWDRVMTHRVNASPESAANDLMGPVAMVWLALDEPGTHGRCRPAWPMPR